MSLISEVITNKTNAPMAIAIMILLVLICYSPLYPIPLD